MAKDQSKTHIKSNHRHQSKGYTMVDFAKLFDDIQKERERENALTPEERAKEHADKEKQMSDQDHFGGKKTQVFTGFSVDLDSLRYDSHKDVMVLRATKGTDGKPFDLHIPQNRWQQMQEKIKPLTDKMFETERTLIALNHEDTRSHFECEGKALATHSVRRWKDNNGSWHTRSVLTVAQMDLESKHLKQRVFVGEPIHNKVTNDQKQQHRVLEKPSKQEQVR